MLNFILIHSPKLYSFQWSCSAMSPNMSALCKIFRSNNEPIYNNELARTTMDQSKPKTQYRSSKGCLLLPLKRYGYLSVPDTPGGVEFLFAAFFYGLKSQNIQTCPLFGLRLGVLKAKSLSVILKILRTLAIPPVRLMWTLSMILKKTKCLGSSFSSISKILNMNNHHHQVGMWAPSDQLYIFHPHPLEQTQVHNSIACIITSLLSLYQT